MFDDYESDYNSLLAKAAMPSLELGRQWAMCLQVFKCVHNIAPKYMSSLLTLQDKNVHNTRSAMALIQQHYNLVRYGQKTYAMLPTYGINCQVVSEP